LPVHRTEHKVDFTGAFLLAASVVSLLLVTVWGGSTYTWGSPEIISLLVAGIVLGGLFIFTEKRAAEPMLPLRLFKSDIFTVSSILSLLVGLVFFAALIFLPEYQQIVRGYSATKSGLLLLPLVVGMIGSMLTSGRLITKFGRYRIYPIIGTIVLAFGLWLFSHVMVNTSQAALSLWMIVTGVGIGMFFQVMTLAVQNTVERKDLGTATSTVTFFRTMGSAFGTALFGAILINRLTHNLKILLPKSALNSSNINIANLQTGSVQIHGLPSYLSQDVMEAFTRSFHSVFIWGIPFALLALIVALFLRETPLKSTTRDMAAGEGLETPMHDIG
jgi:MFS family permease